MKKTFKFSNLGCASCAAKMEDAIKKIEGVIDARIGFFTQTLTVEAAEGAFEALLPQVAAACRRVEPDCGLAL